MCTYGFIHAPRPPAPAWRVQCRELVPRPRHLRSDFPEFALGGYFITLYAIRLYTLLRFKRGTALSDSHTQSSSSPRARTAARRRVRGVDGYFAACVHLLPRLPITPSLHAHPVALEYQRRPRAEAEVEPPPRPQAPALPPLPHPCTPIPGIRTEEAESPLCRLHLVAGHAPQAARASDRDRRAEARVRAADASGGDQAIGAACHVHSVSEREQAEQQRYHEEDRGHVPGRSEQGRVSERAAICGAAVGRWVCMLRWAA